jgi:hypothetical protein
MVVSERKNLAVGEVLDARPVANVIANIFQLPPQSQLVYFPRMSVQMPHASVRQDRIK